MAAAAAADCALSFTGERGHVITNFTIPYSRVRTFFRRIQAVSGRVRVCPLSTVVTLSFDIGVGPAHAIAPVRLRSASARARYAGAANAEPFHTQSNAPANALPAIVGAS